MVIYDSSSWLHSQALHHLAEVIDHPNICILGLGHLDIDPAELWLNCHPLLTLW